MVEFSRRQIGRTGLRVTELGLGCATLGGSRIDVARAAAEAIVSAAWEAGVRYVDTAPFYGVGQAERCVGDALRDRPRDDWVLSTKVGRLLRQNPTGVFADGRHHPLPFDPVYDYSYDGIMRSFEDSLQRLGLARIDILYVHDIGVYQHGAEAHPALMRSLRESGYRALESLRSGGAVQAIGIGVNEREVLLEAMEWGAWDAFLLAGRYTLLEQAAEMRRRRDLDRRRRAAQLRHSCRAGHLELQPGPARRPGASEEDRRSVRRPPGAACGRGVAIPARPSRRRGDHSRPAQRRRVPRQPRPAAPSDPGRAVGGFAAGWAAPSRGAGAELTGGPRRWR
jgi:aryl-alcohol dehydrogenase-like predicted oxidoreductase